jgi:hypothetical protein
MAVDIPTFPEGYPKPSDFPPDKVTQSTFSWAFHRDPGSGGADFGEDHLASADQIVVGFSFNILSDNNTKGHGDLYLILKTLGVFNLPRGLHVGHRLEPGTFTQAGANFSGNGTMQTVSVQDWIAKAVKLSNALTS